MDEQLKTKLLTYLDKIEGAVQTTTDFAAAEIPETIKEYLRWLLVENTIYAILFMVPIITWVCLRNCLGRLIKFGQDNSSQMDDIGVFFAYAFKYILLVGSIISVGIGTTYHTLKAVKVVVAPRVVLLEKIASIVNVNKMK